MCTPSQFKFLLLSLDEHNCLAHLSQNTLNTNQIIHKIFTKTIVLSLSFFVLLLLHFSLCCHFIRLLSPPAVSCSPWSHSPYWDHCKSPPYCVSCHQICFHGSHRPHPIPVWFPAIFRLGSSMYSLFHLQSPLAVRWWMTNAGHRQLVFHLCASWIINLTLSVWPFELQQLHTCCCC